MESKPELIVFSQNLIGGGASFHRNMIGNRPDDFFDIKTIYLDPLHWNAARSIDLKLNENDAIFEFGDEPQQIISERLNTLISNRKGGIIANLPEELITLNIYKKTNKTVFFICHDNGFLSLIPQYKHIIDVFIAHNYQVYESIISLLPERKSDIYFIQHGVKVQNFRRVKNSSNKLNLVFLARHVKIKGIYDLPKIDDELLKSNIQVNWTILGDGEERNNFINSVQHKNNFTFTIANTTEEIISILKEQDIYILPSSHDGLPVSMLEAMSVGCVPIIYNFSDGIKRVVKEDIGYVVDVDDFHEISNKISILNSDRQLLYNKSQNCIVKIESEFNIKTQANEYFLLYKNYKKLKKKYPFSWKSLIIKYSAKYILIRKTFSLLKLIKNKF